MLDAAAPTADRRGMLFYHVTPMRNLPRIRREGLLPKIGRRSRDLGEPAAAIYLFASVDDAENAISNWLGEYFETTRLALLAVDLPAGIPVTEVAFERQVFAPIPPSAISVLDTDFGG
jgi:hypothetical protein